MTADEVIDLRRYWAQFNFANLLPEATVLAEHDWLAYVQAMTAMVPPSDVIVWPTAEEINWAWPDGVAVVFAEPITLSHTIISASNFASGRERVVPTVPHQEQQTLAGLVIRPEQVAPTQMADGLPPVDVEMIAAPLLWIATDPHDIVTGWWMPGHLMQASDKVIAESSRFLMSVLAALGHRLTRLDLPVTAGRGEKRRVARELPGLRVLQLSTGASVAKSDKAPGKVEWTHRWITRGHWRQQACGPKHRLRRLTWIDPFVKGPEHLPLDVRPTVWRTGQNVPEGRL